MALVCGIGVLAFVIYGVMTMGSNQESASRNTLTGKVTKKTFHPAPEEQVTFGNKGVNSRKVEGEYLFEVWVEKEKRSFEVPVDKMTYESTNVGGTLTFERPPSEQSKEQ